jgi:alpha-ketoglutarate-dependent taurine dioxygenase
MNSKSPREARMRSFETRSLGALGVEVLDLDLRDEISDEDFSALREKVIDEGFVLFRGQPMERYAHVALGERFGALENLNPVDDDSAPGLVVIGNVDAAGQVLASDSPFMKLISINEGWHTDSSFRPVPASFSLFSAVVVPPEGGDTYYASLEKGWEALTRDARQSLYGLNGIHDYASAYRRRGSQSGAIVGFDDPPVAHPLVRRHPETGRSILYVSEHIASIEGWSPDDSRRLLDGLIAETTREDRVYRHHWDVGDFAIWDNRSMLHRAQGFDGQHARVMHHVRVSGVEVPIAGTP